MTKANIHIGSVQVPLLDYAVSCTAILGIRDSGKTVTAKGIAEQLLDHDIPIVVFDAVGKWRWMKVPGPGARGKGYKVVVAGGRKPDLALNPHSVGEIVRSAVKEKIPLVIDLYSPNLSKADWRRIVQESIRIIHYEANGVAHVFLEEAAEFIPQKVTDGATYAEVEKLARMGGNASVGLTLINQRSQEVNKAVLDLAHNLILGCQIGNRAIDSVEKWVDRLSPDTAKAVTTSLPHLKSGEAWVWTRSNPDDPKREHLPMCRSLHPDRRTPEVALTSAKTVDPKTFVERLQEAIPRIIEEAKMADPNEWKKEKRRLEAEIKKLESAKAAPSVEPKTKVETKTVERKVVIEATVTRLEKLLERGEKLRDSLQEGVGAINDEVSQIREALADARKINEPFQESVPRIPVHRGPVGPGSVMIDVALRSPTGARSMASTTSRITNIPASAGRDFDRAQSNGDLTKPEQRVLDSLAWWEAIGVAQPDKGQVGFIAGYRVGKNVGGTYGNLLGTLRTRGYLDYPTPGAASLTEEGRQLARFPPVNPTLAALHEAVCSRLSNPEVRVLEAIMQDYPNPVAKQEAGARAGYTVGDNVGGTFGNILGKLRSLGLIDYVRGQAIATELLFPPGLS